MISRLFKLVDHRHRHRQKYIECIILIPYNTRKSRENTKILLFTRKFRVYLRKYAISRKNEEFCVIAQVNFSGRYLVTSSKYSFHERDPGIHGFLVPSDGIGPPHHWAWRHLAPATPVTQTTCCPSHVMPNLRTPYLSFTTIDCSTDNWSKLIKTH